MISRSRFNLEVFGDRLPQNMIIGNDSNRRQIELMRDALKKAIKRELTERQQYILIEYYFKERSMTDIARELGITKSTVSRHISRSKERLKQSLKYGMYLLWDYEK
jgi:RNA polymerase sigma factor (sigma-70 family)